MTLLGRHGTLGSIYLTVRTCC